MKRLFVDAIVAVASSLIAATAIGADFRLSGFVGGELRYFPDEGQYAGQFDHWQPSLLTSPEFRWRMENKDRVTITPFFRVDGQDDKRTHFDLREAYWRRRGEQWDVTVGLDRVFWGVTESRHLINIINSIDGVEDVDEEDFLGQPMVNFATQRDWGNLSLFVLPGFRERTFAGVDGRPRPPLPIAGNNAEYESGAEEWHVDYAARYSHVLGDWDVGTYLFWGTTRDPRLMPNATFTRLIPFYDIITQWGVDIQYTREAWLWKFEGIVREGQGDTFGAFVGGFEYTFYQVNESAADLGVLVEYLHDGREKTGGAAPSVLGDDDVFVGTRYAWNDPQNTSILAGGIIDASDQSTAALVEFETRLGTNWTIAAEARLFINADDNKVMQAFEDDSFINVSLNRFF